MSLKKKSGIRKQRHLREFDASFGVDAKVADTAVKKAPVPGGDPANGDAAPIETSSTSLKYGDRVGKISGVVSKLAEMDDQDLDDLLAKLDGTDDAESGETIKEEDAEEKQSDEKDADDDLVSESDDAEDEKETMTEEDDETDEDGKKKNPFAESDDADADDKDKDKDDESKKDAIAEEEGDAEKKDDEDEKDEKLAESRLRKAMRVSRGDLNLSEDLAAMFKGSALSESFQKKAGEIFEAAVVSKINSRLKKIHKLVEADLKKATTRRSKQLAERLDTYLNYVVEQWMSENRLAVERGLQTELVEDFMAGLKVLFAEHYIQVPQSKVNVVEGLAHKVESLEASLNTEIQANAKLTKLVESHERRAAFSEACQGLTTVQAAKLQPVAEALEYTSKASYTQKLKDLRESYFPAARERRAERTLDAGQMLAEEAPTAPRNDMSAVVATISRQLKK